MRERDRPDVDEEQTSLWSMITAATVHNTLSRCSGEEEEEEKRQGQGGNSAEIRHSILVATVGYISDMPARQAMQKQLLISDAPSLLRQKSFETSADDVGGL